MAWEPVTTTNFVLCVVILALGIWAYVKKKNDVPLYIGIAFGSRARRRLDRLSYHNKIDSLSAGRGRSMQDIS